MNAASFVTQIPFCAHLALQSAASGLELPDAPNTKNHIGTVHAGALYTLGEAASGVVAMRDVPDVFQGLAVVKTASIQYRKPAMGKITADGIVTGDRKAVLERLAADGKVTFDVEVALKDESDVLVATMLVTWYAKRT